jgi:hypothetical protein
MLNNTTPNKKNIASGSFMIKPTYSKRSSKAEEILRSPETESVTDNQNDSRFDEDQDYIEPGDIKTYT